MTAKLSAYLPVNIGKEEIVAATRILLYYSFRFYTLDRYIE